MSNTPPKKTRIRGTDYFLYQILETNPSGYCHLLVSKELPHGTLGNSPSATLHKLTELGKSDFVPSQPFEIFCFAPDFSSDERQKILSGKTYNEETEGIFFISDKSTEPINNSEHFSFPVLPSHSSQNAVEYPKEISIENFFLLEVADASSSGHLNSYSFKPNISPKQKQEIYKRLASDSTVACFVFFKKLSPDNASRSIINGLNLNDDWVVQKKPEEIQTQSLQAEKIRDAVNQIDGYEPSNWLKTHWKRFLYAQQPNRVKKVREIRKNSTSQTAEIIRKMEQLASWESIGITFIIVSTLCFMLNLFLRQ